MRTSGRRVSPEYHMGRAASDNPSSVVSELRMARILTPLAAAALSGMLLTYVVPALAVAAFLR